MKAVFALLGTVVVLGLLYGLAFFGVLPVQKMADKSPALSGFLKALHLAKAKPHALPAVATSAPAPNPEQAALDTGKKQLQADRTQFDQDRLAWEAQKRQASLAPAGDAGANAAKINAIYDTMSADDIARICEKLPDPDVAGVLTALDEKKSGKILAALPADRAARITRRMSHASVTQSASAAPLLHTSL